MTSISPPDKKKERRFQLSEFASMSISSHIHGSKKGGTNANRTKLNEIDVVLVASTSLEA